MSDPVVLSCKELMPFWPMYLDGELQESDAAPYLRHLDTCDRCRGFVEGESRFRQVFRNKIRSSAAERVPDALQARITQMADASPRLPRGRFLLASGTFAVLVALTWTTQSGFSPTLQLVAETHREALPLDVKTNDVAEAQRFVDQHVPRVKLPIVQHPYVRLTGARVLDFRGQRGVIVRYVVGPEMQPVSLVVYPANNERVRMPRAVPAGHYTVFVDQVGELHAAVWQAKDAVYSMVGNLPEAELLDLVSAAE
ncbi:MAG: zf-HC2 domain-containing protein [Deltaproteobacteria bacterium]|nr:zf-HC2 domain-containing protein [Deltaproteobacteria bacterium]